jgi:hypothetical protein
VFFVIFVKGLRAALLWCSSTGWEYVPEYISELLDTFVYGYVWYKQLGAQKENS